MQTGKQLKGPYYSRVAVLNREIRALRTPDYAISNRYALWENADGTVLEAKLTPKGAGAWIVSLFRSPDPADPLLAWRRWYVRVTARNPEIAAAQALALFDAGKGRWDNRRKFSEPPKVHPAYQKTQPDYRPKHFYVE